MGEQDWIISQNRSVGFANNPYKFIDKGGNRVAYTEESGGSPLKSNNGNVQACKVDYQYNSSGRLTGIKTSYNGKTTTKFVGYERDRSKTVCPPKPRTEKSPYDNENSLSRNILKNLDDLLSVLSKGAATTFFLGLTYIAGGIGIGGGLLEFYSGSSGNGLDGKPLSKEEAEYRKKNGLESAITSALNMISVKIFSEINKQNQTNINNSKNDGVSGAKVSAEDIKFTDKFSKSGYGNQVASRGWNNRKIADTINNPAKVYFINETHHVVIDSVTNKVVQVSDLTEELLEFTPGNFSK